AHGHGVTGPPQHADVVEPVAERHDVLALDAQQAGDVRQSRALVAPLGHDLQPVVAPGVAHQVRQALNEGSLDLGVTPVGVEDHLVGVQGQPTGVARDRAALTVRVLPPDVFRVAHVHAVAHHAGELELDVVEVAVDDRGDLGGLQVPADQQRAVRGQDGGAVVDSVRSVDGQDLQVLPGRDQRPAGQHRHVVTGCPRGRYGVRRLDGEAEVVCHQRLV